MNKKIYTLLVLTIALGTANAQEETKIVSSYNPYSLFSPNFYPANNSTTRSAKILPFFVFKMPQRSAPYSGMVNV